LMAERRRSVTGTLFLLLAVVVVVGGLLMRSRFQRSVEGRDPMTDDPVLKEILARGDAPPLEEDEPLDEEAAREAEDRFWEEEWDRPEDWRG
jgi:hypothetical protein